MTHTDPGLAFWLSWAEHRGALAEDLEGGTAVVVLPEGLQRALDLPEQLAVTADPDAAREEGALLLVPGQPVLDQAAELVLADGDSGAAWVSWPEVAAPRTATLVDAARHQFPIDHGRIDPAGEPSYGSERSSPTRCRWICGSRSGRRSGSTPVQGCRRSRRSFAGWASPAPGPGPRGPPQLPADIASALGAAHAVRAPGRSKASPPSRATRPTTAAGRWPRPTPTTAMR